MKRIGETVNVAFSMFSAVPMPHVEWTKQNMRYALCAFPLVGLVLGLCWWGWWALCGLLALPDLLRGGGLCLLPVVITGGIHLDGYADTCDALASFASPARRQEILADPHCGAFAVIRLCAYFVGFFALCCAMKPTQAAVWAMGGGFLLSRSLSGFAVASFPLARDSGLVHTFATAAHRKRVRVILLAEAIFAGVILWYTGRWIGVCMTLAALGTLWFYARTARIKFGGISGDLAGWFLQKAEFWMLTVLVLCQYAEVLF